MRGDFRLGGRLNALAYKEATASKERPGNAAMLRSLGVLAQSPKSNALSFTILQQLGAPCQMRHKMGI